VASRLNALSTRLALWQNRAPSGKSCGSREDTESVMEISELRQAFEERGIRKVKVGGFDVDGILRGKYVALDKFWSAASSGFGFCDVIFGWDIGDVLYDNATVTGWHSGYPDALARIDLSTFRVLPYEPDTACFVCDFHTEGGKQPHPACPRGLLKRVVSRAEASGFVPKFGSEFEFWLFQESPDSLLAKDFRDLVPLSPGMFGYSWVREGQNAELVHDILDTMNAFGIPIEGFHTETGPGVWEAAIRYDDALRAADQAALFKTTMKQIAARHGLAVTFMAKFNASLPGSSGHLHQSLFDTTGEVNLFFDPKAPDSLSKVARHYIGGQVKLARELTALYSPFVNTYKRYVPGVWAPMTASWGIENRTCAIRVIPGGKATRVEYRQTAADINPYVAMATCLAAGLHGVDHAIEPPPPLGGDATFTKSADPLPRTLDEATAVLAKSESAREILGEAFVDHYVRTREWEVRQSRIHVTDWELRRYFEAV
jgi:glutamine synthetase